jgi:oxygen-independent coproporphyrinogen-3 oxidase
VKLLSASPAELERHIAEEVAGDYVYMYPPRQAYRPFGEAELAPLLAESLRRFESVDLYFHFPFCRQICAFCNLFAVAARDGAGLNAYVDYLEREVRHRAPLLRGKTFSTLYLGGGTPSLLAPEFFARLFAFLRDEIGCEVASIPEVALEVSPDTVEEEKFRAYRAIGINRVNLGFQTLADGELHLIGRRYNADTPLRALEIVQSVGFDNVCVDLIYGLQGQTSESWRASVDAVLAYRPETICAYPLTLRPATGFSARGYREVCGREQYARQDYFRAAMLAAGYRQETHIRYVRDERGGYRQKENHWRMANVLGFGAGARSYLWHGDFRNGYSVRHRARALRDYFARVGAAGEAIVDGFVMDDDERMRKAVVLGLIRLDRGWFRSLFGRDPAEVFPEQFAALRNLALLEEEDAAYRLTPRGLRHRDVVVQAFFSERVRRLLESFDYDE